MKPGDLDGNVMVDTADFLTLLAAWGPCAEPCLPACFADINADCSVNTFDFLILLANWG